MTGPELEQDTDIDQAGSLGSLAEGPVRFYSAAGDSITLDTFYQGRACFLTLGGPSLADMNLAALKAPGVVTLGVNNSWATVRPNLWTCLDPPERFCIEGWLDPTITKLVPLCLANARLRVKTAAGEFRPARYRTRDMPAVYFYQRNSRFDPTSFLHQSSVSIGMPERQEDPCGVSGIRSVMLAAVKLAYSLGFRTLYLCGADFKMEEGRANYAFDQGRDRSAVRHNNRLYEGLTKRFEALRPYFEMAEMRVFNCTPGSALEVFPYKRLSEAVREATRGCAGPMNSAGWYDGPRPDPWRRYKQEGPGE